MNQSKRPPVQDELRDGKITRSQESYLIDEESLWSTASEKDNKQVTNLSSGWWYCANGNIAFLFVRGQKILLTDPKQKRGKGYLYYLCELLSLPPRNELTVREFENRIEQDGGEIKEQTFVDAINRLNLKVRTECKTDDDFMIRTDTGCMINPTFNK